MKTGEKGGHIYSEYPKLNVFCSQSMKHLIIANTVLATLFRLNQLLSTGFKVRSVLINTVRNETLFLIFSQFHKLPKQRLGHVVQTKPTVSYFGYEVKSPVGAKLKKPKPGTSST